MRNLTINAFVVETSLDFGVKGKYTQSFVKTVTRVQENRPIKDGIFVSCLL